MLRIFKIFLFVYYSFSSFDIAACDIEIKVDGKQKEQYKIGETVKIKVTVTFTHRVCKEGIEKTEFTENGVKILNKILWKETEPNVWETTFKIKITGNKTGTPTLSAIRTCDKEGGKAELVLHAETLE